MGLSTAVTSNRASAAARSSLQSLSVRSCAFWKLSMNISLSLYTVSPNSHTKGQVLTEPLSPRDNAPDDVPG